MWNLFLFGRYDIEYEKLNKKKVSNLRQVKSSMCIDLKLVKQVINVLILKSRYYLCLVGVQEGFKQEIRFELGFVGRL